MGLYENTSSWRWHLNKARKPWVRMYIVRTCRRTTIQVKEQEPHRDTEVKFIQWSRSTQVARRRKLAAGKVREDSTVRRDDVGGFQQRNMPPKHSGFWFDSRLGAEGGGELGEKQESKQAEELAFIKIIYVRWWWWLRQEHRSRGMRNSQILDILKIDPR